MILWRLLPRWLLPRLREAVVITILFADYEVDRGLKRINMAFHYLEDCFSCS
jgi:hypothetical protein